jgi:hypothetical protein
MAASSHLFFSSSPSPFPQTFTISNQVTVLGFYMNSYSKSIIEFKMLQMFHVKPIIQFLFFILYFYKLIT